MILVTGATGTVGREVVALLVQAGQRVRAFTRDPKKAHFGSGVEVIVGDLDRPDTLEKAFQGVERVFSLSTGPQLGVHDANVAKVAKRAGVKHIVKLSVMGAGMGADTAITHWHEAGEKAILDSGVSWTLVRPGIFMSNSLQWVGTIKAQGKVFGPFGDGKMVPVHPRDIAAVAVKALTTPGHEGKAYLLTGPESLNMAEQVRVLAEETGRAIQYVAVPPEAARDNMLKAGMPANYADALLKVAAMVRAGQMGQPLPTVQQVTGRKALTWHEWARENALAFK
jgi:uncharacterized protein YbjT (DUF2867 family)